VLVLFVLAIAGFRRVPQNFFPPATRPQFLVDVFLPAGSHIADSEAFAEAVEGYLLAQPGVTHVSSFVGSGGLGFPRVSTPQRDNRAFVQFLVQVDDTDKLDGVRLAVQHYLDENYPDANAVAKKFLLGPGAGGRIQARFSGPDPPVLRQLADQAERILVA